MKYKIFFLVILFITVPSISNSATILQLDGSMSSTLVRPFGGKILTSYECTCSGGWLIYFYDYLTKMPIPIVFQFGVSRLNQNFNIYTPNANILGTYTPGGICSIGSSSCFTVPVVGTITSYPMSGIGTSSF